MPTLKLAPSGQRARERFGDVPADEGFAQHVADAGGMCAVGEPRAAVAAHENYGNVGSYPPDLARELRTAEVRHCLVGQDEIEATWVGAEGLQRGDARIEPGPLITKL